MKVLIFGASGLLGHKLVQVLSKDFEVWSTVRDSFKVYEKFNIFKKNYTFEKVDVRNTIKIKEIIEDIKPDVIINAVGIIKQIPNSKDVINTLTINSIFPHQLAEISKNISAYLINISTDCVFSGASGNYTEEDIPDAFDLYGKSKNLGEVTLENCLTIRTSIIGRELLTSHSLVEWFFSNEGKKVKGFTNAIFSGLPTVILSETISNLIAKKNRLEGLYHISSKSINKFDLLKLIKEKFGLKIEIEASGTFKIDRSLNSDKFKKATGFEPLNWDQMIEKMAKDAIVFGKYNK